MSTHAITAPSRVAPPPGGIPSEGPRLRVMFFAPHAAIWQHAFPEALAAEALAQAGHEIVYVSCGRRFAGYCVAMSAAGLDATASAAEKGRVCERCESNDAVLRREFGFRGPRLDDLLDARDHEAAAALAAAARPDAIESIAIDGVPLGRVALYEFLLNHKLDVLEIPAALWPAYLIALTNAAYAYLAARRAMTRLAPDRVVAYNSFYSVNHAACLAAERAGAQHFLLHAGTHMAYRMRTLLMARGYSYNALARHPRWRELRERPIGRAEQALVTDHLLALFRAQSGFVYSAPLGARGRSLRERYGIGASQRLLVATMSSHDERFAAQAVGVMAPDAPTLFATQVDWIAALAEYVAARPQLFLLVRVHPREFPNRRDRVESAHARRLRERLVGLPANAAVNWPGDAVSIYDLAWQADVFLNCRSTTGLEMSWLGMPVVLYSPHQMFAYPPDLNDCADTRDAYFAAIETALERGWSAETARRAYRWGAVQFAAATIDIAESYVGEGGAQRGWLARALGRVRRVAPAGWSEARECRRRAPRLAHGALLARLIESGADTLLDVADRPAAAEQAGETAGLRAEMARLLAALEAVPGAAGSRLAQSMRGFIAAEVS